MVYPLVICEVNAVTQPTLPLDSTEVLTYCEKHPDRETGLRCNKCDRLMCSTCAVRTPVGYRCRECVRGIEDQFFNATPSRQAAVAVVCALLGAVAGGIVSAIGLPLLFTVFIGVAAGTAISQMGIRAAQRERGRYLAEIAAASTAMGGLLGAFVQKWLAFSALLEGAFRASDVAPGELLRLVFQLMINDLGTLVFIGIVAAMVLGRFRLRR